MTKDFVIFKNPYLRYRKEDFGGILKLKIKTLIVNKKQLNLIEKIKKVLVYSSLNDFDKKIVNKLLENNVLLKVDIDKAKELGFNK